MLHIWFNRTFATSYWLLDLLRHNPDRRAVKLYATHVDAHSPVLAAADHRELEPSIGGEDYLTWALRFCQQHAIRIFVPAAHVQLIAANRALFERQGVTVLTSPVALLELFANKRLTYESLHQQGFALPPYRTASTADGIEAAYQGLLRELDDPTAEIVIKPTVGVGAQGFRIITQRDYSLDDLFAINDPRTTLNRVLTAYTAATQPLPEIMLMPFLAGPETSVDTLSSPTGQVMQTVARVKETPRLTRLTAPTGELAAYLTNLLRHYPLAYVTNIQFRWWEHKPVLLEVNVRPSGGLHAVRNTGVNMLWDAVRMALGQAPHLPTPHLDEAYANIDNAIIVPQ